MPRVSQLKKKKRKEKKTTEGYTGTIEYLRNIIPVSRFGPDYRRSHAR